MYNRQSLRFTKFSFCCEAKRLEHTVIIKKIIPEMKHIFFHIICFNSLILVIHMDLVAALGGIPVSYTHLDVYKRQGTKCSVKGNKVFSIMKQSV